MHPLKVLEEDEVNFEFKNEMSPGVFKNNGQFSCGHAFASWLISQNRLRHIETIDKA